LESSPVEKEKPTQLTELLLKQQ